MRTVQWHRYIHFEAHGSDRSSTGHRKLSPFAEMTERVHSSVPLINIGHPTFINYNENKKTCNSCERNIIL